jgi:hypothetical protein
MSAIMANGWARPDPAPNSSSWREAPLPGHSTYRIQPCHVRQSARRNHDSREASIQVDAARRRLSLKARDAPFAQFAERLADTLLQVRGILESATNTGEIGRHADSSLPVRGLRATRHLRRTSVLRNWPLGACSDVSFPLTVFGLCSSPTARRSPRIKILRSRVLLTHTLRFASRIKSRVAFPITLKRISKHSWRVTVEPAGTVVGGDARVQQTVNASVQRAALHRYSP